jgi:hypothetical protein
MVTATACAMRTGSENGGTGPTATSNSTGGTSNGVDSSALDVFEDLADSGCDARGRLPGRGTALLQERRTHATVG